MVLELYGRPAPLFQRCGYPPPVNSWAELLIIFVILTNIIHSWVTWETYSDTHPLTLCCSFYLNAFCVYITSTLAYHNLIVSHLPDYLSLYSFLSSELVLWLNCLVYNFFIPLWLYCSCFLWSFSTLLKKIIGFLIITILNQWPK